MMKSLDEIKAECTVLNRTVMILKSRAGNVDEFMKELEKKKGITGYTSVEDQIVGVSELKEQLDNNKSQSLQELTALVQQIESMKYIDADADLHTIWLHCMFTHE